MQGSRHRNLTLWKRLLPGGLRWLLLASTLLLVGCKGYEYSAYWLDKNNDTSRTETRSLSEELWR